MIHQKSGWVGSAKFNTYRVAAGHVAKIKDQRHPRVSQAALKIQIFSKPEDSGLAQERLVVVLERIRKAHLPPIVSYSERFLVRVGVCGEIAKGK